MKWLTGQGYIRRQIKTDEIAQALGTVSRSFSLWPILAILLLLMLLLEALQCRKMSQWSRAADLPAMELPAMSLL